MGLLQDIRYAIRTLLNAPGFTLGATLTLALGIGANTAIFSLIQGVLIRPLPYRDPGRLVRIHATEPVGYDRMPTTGPDFVDFRRRSRLFETMASLAPDGANLTGGDRPDRVQLAQISFNFFSVFGVRPMLGRDLSPADEWDEGKPLVMVLSYGLWQRAFGTDPKIVGRKITLDGHPCEVVGVMPKDFHPIVAADLWFPVTQPTAEDMRGSHDRYAIGRLKPGVTIERAQAEMTSIAQQLQSEHPITNKGIGVNLVALATDVTGGVRNTLLVFLFAVAFVVLIACVNVANLLLARGTARQHELSVRTAMGASRWRVVRQLLTESLVLALCGGALGLLMAVWGVDALRHSSALGIPRADEVGVDSTVLAYSALASILTGLFFGLAPALQLSNCDLGKNVRESGSRTVASGRGSSLRGALVSAEIALGMVLLVGSALMLRSFVRLISVDPGFHAAGVLTAQAELPDLPIRTYEDKLSFNRQLIERLRAIPGVTSAAVTSKLPLAGGNNGTIIAEGQPFSENAWDGPLVEFSYTLPGYFHTMGIPLLAGRDFTGQDFAKNSSSVVVNQALVRRFFPHANPIGKRISHERKPPKWREIVGVVGDTRQWGLAQAPIPEMYWPSASNGFVIVIRAASDPKQLTDSVRREVAALDKDLPLYHVQAMDELVADSSASSRSRTALVGLFAAVALTLAAIGVYGLVSFSMSLRRHEIGIRVALGAGRRDVIIMALRDSGKLIAAGLALGLSCSFALTRYLASELFEVSPMDPLTFVAVPLFLVAVALAASYIPAQRAAAVDPAIALRHE
jgi:putative ABC transport system permease protein